MEKFEYNEKKIKSGFKIPEDYFETLESKILNNLPTETKVKPLFPKKMIGWTIAASLILVASLTLLPVEKEKNQDLAQETLQKYFETEHLNEFLLTEMLTDEDIKSMEITQDFDSNEIENYLEKTVEKETFYYN